jgi:hypothetical protein
MKSFLRNLACIWLASFLWGNVLAQYNQTQKLIHSRKEAFPVGVDMTDRFAVIGNKSDAFDANGANPLTDAGSVDVMEKQPDGSWKFQKKIVSPNREVSAGFGASVAISGNYMAIAAPGETVGGFNEIGAVYMFRWDGSKWVEMPKLLGVRDAGESRFGRSLALDGTNLVIGSQLKLYGKPANGMAYLYSLDKGIWIRKGALTPTELNRHSNYGQSVAIQGLTAVVGDSDQAHLHVFKFNGYYWNEEAQVNVGKSIRAFAIDRDYLLAGVEDVRTGTTAYINLGAVQVFKRTGTTWTAHQTLTASDRGSSGWGTIMYGSYFGNVLDVVNGMAVIGAPFDDLDASAENNKQKAGAAYIFKLEGDSWKEHQKIVASDRAEMNLFGFSVATAGGTVLVRDGKSAAGIYVYNKASFPSSSCAITKVRIFPKIGCTTCLIGGQVQVSNVGTTGPWTTIFNVSSQAAGRWNDYAIPSSPGDYKAIRYVGAYGSHCGVAEIEFYKGAAKLTGALFHDGGGAWEAGAWDYTKAFDGKTDTYYYGRKLNGYIGILTSCAGAMRSAFASDSTFADNGTESIDVANTATEVVFPNPLIGAERLHVNSHRKEVIKMISILDRNGKTRLTSQHLTDIDASGLAPGMYSVQVMYSDGKVGSHQLVKK